MMPTSRCQRTERTATAPVPSRPPGGRDPREDRRRDECREERGQGRDDRPQRQRQRRRSQAGTPDAEPVDVRGYRQPEGRQRNRGGGMRGRPYGRGPPQKMLV